MGAAAAGGWTRRNEEVVEAPMAATAAERLIIAEVEIVIMTITIITMVLLC